MSDTKSTEARTTPSATTEDGLLIEAPGHTDLAFLDKELGKGNPLPRENNIAHIDRRSADTDEPCSECKQFPGIVHRVLTKEQTENVNVNTNPLDPRSLASVAREEDAVVQQARVAWLASEQAKIRRLTQPKKQPWTNRQPDSPPSNTFKDWARTASHNDLVALLVRNNHPMWFIKRCNADQLRDYIINARFKITFKRNVMPHGHKAEYEWRERANMVELRKLEKEIEAGTHHG